MFKTLISVSFVVTLLNFFISRVTASYYVPYTHNDNILFSHVAKFFSKIYHCLIVIVHAVF